MNKTISLLLILFLVSLCVNVKADIHRAHVHGVATLTLALENEVLEIQFESPAASLVGFEHKAVSLQEKQAIKQMQSLLKSPELLFEFTGAKCQSKEATIDLSGGMASEEKEHDHHGHHHHKKENHHDHAKEKDHDSHSEIKASYLFSCQQSQNLTSVSIALFKQFPGIEKINAMWITNIRQDSAVLSADKNTISLR